MLKNRNALNQDRKDFRGYTSFKIEGEVPKGWFGVFIRYFQSVEAYSSYNIAYSLEIVCYSLKIC